MKILALHAAYRIRGGEDVSHSSEVKFLRAAGHDVYDLVLENASLAQKPRHRQAASPVRNAEAKSHILEQIDRFEPAAIYVNNTFPAIPPDVFRSAHARGVPSVHVLRNFRVACLSASTFRNGRLCNDCVGRGDLLGVVHGCYEGSVPASAAIAIGRAINARRGLKFPGTSYIAVSRYVGENAMAAGLPANKLRVRHNLVWPVPAMPTPARPEGQRFLFVGRDSEEKGLPQLVEAVRRVYGRSGIGLDIIGDAVGMSDDVVSFRGRMSSEEVLAEMGAARLVVVPSLWPEPFGRVVIESLAVGTPALVARVGGMSELEGKAVFGFDHENQNSLDSALLRIASTGHEPYENLRLEARSRFESDFSGSSWLALTEDAINSAVTQVHKGG